MDIVNEMERARLLGTTPPTADEIGERIGELEDEAYEAGEREAEVKESIKERADDLIGCRDVEDAETSLQRLLAHCGQDESTAANTARAFIETVRKATAAKP